MLEKCFLNVRATVPATTDKAAWTATSTVLGQRINMVRTGTKLDGGTWTRSQLLNIAIKIGDNVLPVAAKIFKDFQAKHNQVVTLQQVASGGAAATGQPGTSQPRVRPMMMKSMKKVRKTALKKKPAGRS